MRQRFAQGTANERQHIAAVGDRTNPPSRMQLAHPEIAGQAADGGFCGKLTAGTGLRHDYSTVQKHS